jgi:hypothetical protein
LKAPPSTANYAERARRESAPARPLAHRWRVGLTSLAAVSAAAMVFAGGYAVLHFHLGGGAASSLSTTAGGAGTSAGTARRPNSAAGPPGSTASSISRAQAIADAIRGNGATNITGVAARLTTFAEYQRIGATAALPHGAAQRLTPVAGTSAAPVGAQGDSSAGTQLVWVVTVQGRLRPDATTQQPYDWVVEAIDAGTGQPIASYAGVGSWPPAGFSSLGDLGGP